MGTVMLLVLGEFSTHNPFVDSWAWDGAYPVVSFPSTTCSMRKVHINVETPLECFREDYMQIARRGFQELQGLCQTSKDFRQLGVLLPVRLSRS